MIRTHFYGSILALAVSLLSCSAAAQDRADPFESVGETSEEPFAEPDEAAIAIEAGAPAPRIPVDLPFAVANPPEQTIIGSIHIAGQNAMPQGLFAPALEKFIGQDATAENLQSLADALSKAAQDEGYIFASVEVPAQAVKIGVVMVDLIPGAIDEVRILGSDNARLKKILNRLVTKAGRKDIIERQLLLAEDVSGITIKNTTYEREGDVGVLVVTASEDRISASASADNFGPETLGPVRARLRYRVANLLGDGDRLSFSLTNSLTRPDELTYVRLRYATMLDQGSTVVGLTGGAGRTYSGGALRAFDFRGHNRFASLFVNHNLVRSNDFNLWLNGELAYRQIRQRRAGLLLQEDRLTTASLDLSGNKEIGIGRLYGGVGVTQGLGILGASEAGDPLSSRSNASGEFTRAQGWLNAIIDIGKRFGLRLAANGQITSDPLLSSEEMGFGGAYFGRGYDFSERYGDEGAVGLAEFRVGFSDVNAWLDWLQFYSFVDGGYVHQIDTGFGSGTLSSAGGGLRASVGKFDLEMEAAAPLIDEREESGDKSAKLNMQVGVRF